MTNDRINAIKARCEAATKEVESHKAEDMTYRYAGDITFLLTELDRLNGLIGCGCGICLAHNNMQCPKMPATPKGE